MRVLVVDDDPSVRGMVRAGLEHLEVLEAGDGPSALALLAEVDPVDVVLIDIGMPGMDGYDLLRTIRRDPGLRDVGVLMLTGHVGELEHLAAFRLGAHGYLTKPIDPDDLAAAVDDVAGRSPRDREAVRQEELARAELLQRLERTFSEG